MTGPVIHADANINSVSLSLSETHLWSTNILNGLNSSDLWFPVRQSQNVQVLEPLHCLIHLPFTHPSIHPSVTNPQWRHNMRTLLSHVYCFVITKLLLIFPPSLWLYEQKIYSYVDLRVFLFWIFIFSLKRSTLHFLFNISKLSLFLPMALGPLLISVARTQTRVILITEMTIE